MRLRLGTGDPGFAATGPRGTALLRPGGGCPWGIGLGIRGTAPRRAGTPLGSFTGPRGVDPGLRGLAEPTAAVATAALRRLSPDPAAGVPAPRPGQLATHEPMGRPAARQRVMNQTQRTWNFPR